ncbi:23S rRNA (cytidine(2498)-2'-O)-methyltransferase RlmM [Alteromonas sp. 1_MG-2023]|uniref:23S rRNA (cytidine(2498)-2'-O)-methyltransferase RlmM n=1 Tax=Alteromonas sp. 1_MG-2023 TaxID=3062669 RepID=UPI0026E348F4|nr:23S rRNA (cytidine(2498)-2'-O)-methyltransferase RlmM [Alteromonas sp. 1_MG-2023]MDO6476184.1 23S rRNA (cytidine(2498)-2'-O)-methyltransferase RlmM [Alteromonas sp. 1_MG-2023]
MNSLLIYCRSGYEADTAGELTALSSEAGIYGYPVFTPDQGFILFHFYEQGDADRLGQRLAVADTIFPRQIVVVTAHLEDLDKTNRAGPVLAAISDADTDEWKNTLLFVEHADTEAGKALAKFCRKFTVPLRQGLRKQGALTYKEREDGRALHVFFTDYDNCFVGHSYPAMRSPFANGICRLKFPPKAPSRSTLKLEEAILTMLDDEERREIFREGARAVDLGACPGGWTYQLVIREMGVEAIDNGAIDEELMATGLVDHYAADGFTYKPKFGRVDLLVCDMIERPDRVAVLMSEWLEKGWADHAIFNLKLPMKKRYDTVTAAIGEIQSRLGKKAGGFRMKVRHLYHNRDEVTVTVIKA